MKDKIILVLATTAITVAVMFVLFYQLEESDKRKAIEFHDEHGGSERKIESLEKKIETLVGEIEVLEGRKVELQQTSEQIQMELRRTIDDPNFGHLINYDTYETYFKFSETVYGALRIYTDIGEYLKELIEERSFTPVAKTAEELRPHSQTLLKIMELLVNRNRLAHQRILSSEHQLKSPDGLELDTELARTIIELNKEMKKIPGIEQALKELSSSRRFGKIR